jgi:carbohydrate-selective porin OprB
MVERHNREAQALVLALALLSAAGDAAAQTSAYAGSWAGTYTNDETTSCTCTAAFDPNAAQATAAGTITVTFTDANNAVLSYTVGGVTATKNVTRQLF